MESKIKIFFSYSSHDKEHLNLLKILIKSIDKHNQIDYFDFVEKNDNTLDSNYAKIYEQISQCNFFISILTKNYLGSSLCCWEAGLAFQENKKNKKFNMLALLLPKINILELERTFNNQFIFDRNGLLKLLKYIKESEEGIQLATINIDENLENLQKQTEQILLKKVISESTFTKNEMTKLNKLIE